MRYEGMEPFLAPNFQKTLFGRFDTVGNPGYLHIRHMNKKMAMAWSILGIYMLVIGIIIIVWGSIRLQLLKNEYHDYLRRCFSSCPAADWNYFTNVLLPQLSNTESWIFAYLLSGGIALVAGIVVIAFFLPKMRILPSHE